MQLSPTPTPIFGPTHIPTYADSSVDCGLIAIPVTLKDQDQWNESPKWRSVLYPLANRQHNSKVMVVDIFPTESFIMMIGLNLNRRRLSGKFKSDLVVVAGPTNSFISFHLVGAYRSLKCTNYSWWMNSEYMNWVFNSNTEIDRYSTYMSGGRWHYNLPLDRVNWGSRFVIHHALMRHALLNWTVIVHSVKRTCMSR